MGINKQIITKITILFLFTGVTIDISAQEYYKLNCDISIKERFSETKFSLIKGRVEYNKYDDITTYNFTFPSRETWILNKDSLTRTVKNKTDYKIPTSAIYKYSVFKLFFNGTLKNYGLKESLYEISEIKENSDGSVYTTWKPSKKMKIKFGKVMTSQKNGLLQGVIFYNLKNQLIGKQFFKDYINIKGMMFPSKIIEITVIENEKHYKITEFTNVVLL